MEIIECKTLQEILANYPIVTQLYPLEQYPHMDFETYSSLIPEMQKQDYRQIGVFEDGKCLGVAGFNVTIRLYRGKVIRINDLVVDGPQRGRGIGKMLIGWIEQEARRLDCKAIVLDSGVPRKDAHRFYEREGFNVHALHFTKWL